jgi:hypothetical protein
MVGLFVNHEVADDERRTRLFAGNLFLRSRSPASDALCEHAIQFIKEAFGPHDPQRAQFQSPVAEFISRVGPLKTRFTNDLETKHRIRDLLAEMDCDLDDVFFDVPRLRVVPHGDYLSAGVSYAYKPHRDIWYSSPSCQVNVWMPVFEVVPERAMSFFPAYFSEPVANSSGDFDYDEWCAVGRQNAVAQVSKDTRKHPLPLEPVAGASELRIAGTKGDAILFSAAHLHATAPNQSGLTRFSIDFRTICMTDLKSGRGAPNVDCRATGTTLADFIKARDFSPIDLQLTERAQAARRA